jgi:hypothetical protein
VEIQFQPQKHNVEESYEDCGDPIFQRIEKLATALDVTFKLLEMLTSKENYGKVKKQMGFQCWR